MIEKSFSRRLNQGRRPANLSAARTAVEAARMAAAARVAFCRYRGIPTLSSVVDTMVCVVAKVTVADVVATVVVIDFTVSVWIVGISRKPQDAIPIPVK